MIVTDSTLPPTHPPTHTHTHTHYSSQAVDILHPWTLGADGSELVPFTTFSIAMINRQVCVGVGGGGGRVVSHQAAQLHRPGGWRTP